VSKGDTVTDNAFFDETTEQSLVKATIVSKYFGAWAKVIIPTAKQTTGKIAYIDLFAGPGRYKDGTKSTPLLVLEKAIQDPDMRQMLVTMFNDRDEANCRSLEEAIKGLPGIDLLKYPPDICVGEVGDGIVGMFAKMHLVPTLFFVDPWGYKGLSLRLVNSVIKDWGCDCIFFFNYNRINMGLPNEAVQDHMDALFGKQRADDLRTKLLLLDPQEREMTIVEEISQALKAMGGQYVLPFCFKNAAGKRTSHHLVFVSKNFRGYEIMKGIMARESSSTAQGVPSFTYSPADARQKLLFSMSQPLEELGEMLMEEFAGQQLTMRQIYEKHNVGRPFIAKNYKDVLRRLEADGRITAFPAACDRLKRKGESTFADTVTVAFPPRSL
jgi:three-Cys-motif partner protein